MSVSVSPAAVVSAAASGWPASADPSLRRAPDAARLSVIGEQMRRHPKHRGDSLALLVMQVHDLPELEVLFGRGAAALAVAHAMTQLTRVAAREGVAIRTDSDTFAVLMPGGDADDLLEAIQAQMGPACCIEFEHGGEEILLVPELLARRVGSTESVAQAYDTLCSDIARARSCERRRHDALRRERESHTRPIPMPMPIPMPQHDPLPPPRGPAAPQAQTIRMGLA